MCIPSRNRRIVVPQDLLQFMQDTPAVSKKRCACERGLGIRAVVLSEGGRHAQAAAGNHLIRHRYVTQHYYCLCKECAKLG